MIVCAAILAIAFAKLGSAKVAVHPRMVERAHHVGFSASSYRVIGLLELAAAVGVLAGLAWRPLGVAAAFALVILLLGACIAHLRVRASIAALVPALVLGVVAVAYLVAAGGLR
jgi:hypothetical protein